jgi:hypothetical protein
MMRQAFKAPTLVPHHYLNLKMKVWSSAQQGGRLEYRSNRLKVELQTLS